MLVHELLNNSDFHNYHNFAKFLTPIHRDNKFSEYIWKELIKNNNLQKILKKVFTKERIYPKSSYELIFIAINSWIKPRESRAWKDDYYNFINNSVINYFCHEDIFIVFIDENNKTFLPSKKTDKKYSNSLFYQSQLEIKSSTLQLNLLDSIKSIKVSNFDYLGEEKYTRTSIVRKFSTISILTVLKDIEDSFDNILLFVSQLLNETKDELSSDLKKQLKQIKIPIKNGGYKEAQYCYFNIDKNITQFFNDEFQEVDLKQIQIEDKQIFLEKLGVFNNKLPNITSPSSKKILLPFDTNCNFPKSNLLKYLINETIRFMDESVVKKLLSLEWFYDERKDRTYKPCSGQPKADTLI